MAKWIQKAVSEMKRKGTKGALTREAKGESPMKFAAEHKNSKGLVGKRSRFALNANKH